MAQTMTEKSREEGVAIGQRALLQDQLEQRFGQLPDRVRQRLAAWPAERLRELGRSLLTAPSLREMGLDDDLPL